MAAPITHIVLTEKIFDKFFSNKTKKEFYIGTLFPDIRYLGVVEREKTHYKNLNISDLQNKSSFEAGLMFHSILDRAREKFIVKNNLYSICPKSKYITQSLKILEDEILYHHSKNWKLYIEFLSDILENEKNYRVDDVDIKKWHSILQKYFKKQPNENSISVLATDVGFSKDAILEMNNNIKVMQKNKKIIKTINNLYNNFESFLKINNKK